MKQCEFVFIALTTFIYLLYFAQCQYTTIWNDNFDTNSGWTCGNGNFGSCSNSTCVSDWEANVCFVPWSDTQPYCENSPCAQICAIGNGYKSRWLQKSTNIAAYSALELQFSVGIWNKETKLAKCQIYYSYDAGAFQNQWERSGDGTAYNDQVQVLGSTEYATNVTIKLQVYGNSADCDTACYFDNIILNGILRTDAPTVMPTTSNPTTSNPTTSTLTPTKSPSKYPSKFPTQFPTTTPTNIPTEFPSKFPTQIPTISPTKTPTLKPTISPTKYPTKTPTTPSPTLVINSNPTQSPSKSIIHTTAAGNLNTATSTESHGPNNSNTNENSSDQIIFFTLIASVLCCAGVLLFLWMKYLRIKKRSIVDSEFDKMGDYVQLVDVDQRYCIEQSQSFNQNGQVHKIKFDSFDISNSIAQTAPVETCTPIGPVSTFDVSETAEKIGDNSDDDDIYKYSAPTTQNPAENVLVLEGDMDTEILYTDVTDKGDDDNDDNNDENDSDNDEIVLDEMAEDLITPMGDENDDSDEDVVKDMTQQ